MEVAHSTRERMNPAEDRDENMAALTIKNTSVAGISARQTCAAPVVQVWAQIRRLRTTTMTMPSKIDEENANCDTSSTHIVCTLRPSDRKIDTNIPAS